jgi:NADPH:quinone reductase-like Zn-dependent oxidoreductase
MKAVILERYGDDPDLLQLADAPEPQVGPNDVLVDVHAAGFNPFECKLRKGWLQRFYPFPLPHVLGNDFAGVVAAKGERVWGLEVGDKVYGMQQTMRRGSYAERMAIQADCVRRMPGNLSFLEAASIPMVYETAWMGLVDLAMTRPGQLVLVHGASGGVGSAAVLLAKAIGARVAATCSTDAVDFVRGLGADVVIDYRQQDFTRVLQNVDVVFDPIGKETNLRSYEVMRPGATMLVVLREDKLEIENRDRLCAEKGVSCRVVAFEQRADVLDYVRPLFESGALKPVVTRTLPLQAANEAHRASDAGHARGKTVLTVR